MKARVGTRQGKWHLPGCHSHIYPDVKQSKGDGKTASKTRRELKWLSTVSKRGETTRAEL